MTAQDMLPLGEFTAPQHRADATIEERWTAFKQANPWVLDALDRLASSAWMAGRRRVGIKHLFEVLRWQWEMTTTDPEGWRLNNVYTSRAARDLLARHPEWVETGFIETRQLKAA
jgi:hypothetical protein